MKIEVSPYLLGLLEQYRDITERLDAYYGQPLETTDLGVGRALSRRRNLLCYEALGALQGAINTAKRQQGRGQ